MTESTKFYIALDSIFNNAFLDERCARLLVNDFISYAIIDNDKISSETVYRRSSSKSFNQRCVEITFHDKSVVRLFPRVYRCDKGFIDSYDFDKTVILDESEKEVRR